MSVLACLVFSTLPAVAAPEGWALVSDSEGVEVARKTMPDSPLFAFRGEGDLPIHVSLLAQVLIDDAIGPQWVDLMYLSEMLRPEGAHQS